LILRNLFLAAILAGTLAAFVQSGASASEPVTAPLRLADVLARSYEIGVLERPAKAPVRSMTAVIQDLLMPDYLSEADIVPRRPLAIQAAPIYLPQDTISPGAWVPPARPRVVSLGAVVRRTPWPVLSSVNSVSIMDGPTLSDAMADRRWRKRTSERLQRLWR
jgi:hypothetical protein